MERIFTSCFSVAICRILSSTRSSAQHIIFSHVLLPFLYFEALSQNIHLDGNTVPPLFEPERKDFWQSSSCWLTEYYHLLITIDTIKSRS